MYQWADRVTSAVGSMYDRRPRAQPLRGKLDTATHADMCRVLRAYYESNGLFDELALLLRREGIAKEALKPLRNPAYRAVEFYPRLLWPGTLPDALPISAKKKSIIRFIQQVWEWSNWGSTKQVAARHIALYGNLWIKVTTAPADARGGLPPRRVFFQLIEDEHVTDFDLDERDFLTFIRIDKRANRRKPNGSLETVWHTEVWNKADGSFRVWEHQQGPEKALDQLGTPARIADIRSFGIDFIPISHAKFSDIGQDRGMGALVPALDKIDEVCRKATRLSQMLFRHNNVTNALNGGVDSSGRPMPPPQVNNANGTNSRGSGIVTFGDDDFIALPGNSTLQQLVPNLRYEAALLIQQDDMHELEHDLPELVLYRLSDEGNLSGRAVRLMMTPAITRLEEVRGNAEGALVRADQMALTIGKEKSLFRGLGGDFESGAFDHSFEERDVLPTDELERAQAQQADGQALKAYVEAGLPVEIAVQELWGWSAERAAQFTKDRLTAIQREQQLSQDDMPPEGEGVTQ